MRQQLVHNLKLYSHSPSCDCHRLLEQDLQIQKNHQVVDRSIWGSATHPELKISKSWILGLHIINSTIIITNLYFTKIVLLCIPIEYVFLFVSYTYEDEALILKVATMSSDNVHLFLIMVVLVFPSSFSCQKTPNFIF